MRTLMDRVPGDIVQRILCRLPFKEVLMIREMSPQLVAEADLKEIAEMGRLVYSDTRSPAFLALLEDDCDTPGENRYRLLVFDVHGQIEQANLPLLKGEMKVIATCKGLALITVRNYDLRQMGRGLWRTFVLNFSSGGSIEIRQPPKYCKSRKTSRKRRDHCRTCGSSYSVGYDIATNLFTILRITTSRHTAKGQTFFDIYSSETRQWKVIISEFVIEMFLPYRPVYSNGRFFFIYQKYEDDYYRTAKLGIITVGNFSFDSLPLPYVEGKWYLYQWSIDGWEGGIIVCYHSVYWRFKEEVLDVNNSSYSDYQDCWEDCQERIVRMLEIADGTFEYSPVRGALHDSLHVAVVGTWEDKPEDMLCVCNARGEIVNRLTESQMCTALGLAPGYDEDERGPSVVGCWTLEKNNIAWPWPRRDFDSMRKGCLNE